MRRRGLVALALLIAMVASVQAVQAQSVSSAQLSAAALDAGDLPGAVQDFETARAANGTLFDQFFNRGWAYRDSVSGFHYAVDVVLLSPAANAATAALHSTIADGSQCHATATTTATQFRAAAALGVGDADAACTWSDTFTDGSGQLTDYADNFLRGRLVVTVYLVLPTSTAHPDQDWQTLRGYARQQDAKALRLLPQSLVGPFPPGAPLNLVATAVDATSIRLNWASAAGAAGEDGFRIYEASVAAPFPAAMRGSTSYVVRGLAPASYHCFIINAFNAGGVSGWSSWACATTPAALQPPGAPRNLTATTIDSQTIALSWTAGSGNADGFAILDAAFGTEVQRIDAVTTSTTLAGLEPGHEYCSTVYAFNAAGNSANSNEACAITAP